jgi:hypothetical protein
VSVRGGLAVASLVMLVVIAACGGPESEYQDARRELGEAAAAVIADYPSIDSPSRAEIDVWARASVLLNLTADSMQNAKIPPDREQCRRRLVAAARTLASPSTVGDPDSFFAASRNLTAVLKLC